jgi:hypothetical protein
MRTRLSAVIPRGESPEGERRPEEGSVQPGQAGGNGPRVVISTTPESTGEWGREPKGRTGWPLIRRDFEAAGRER